MVLPFGNQTHRRGISPLSSCLPPSKKMISWHSPKPVPGQLTLALAPKVNLTNLVPKRKLRAQGQLWHLSQSDPSSHHNLGRHWALLLCSPCQAISIQIRTGCSQSQLGRAGFHRLLIGRVLRAGTELGREPGGQGTPSWAAAGQALCLKGNSQLKPAPGGGRGRSREAAAVPAASLPRG